MIKFFLKAAERNSNNFIFFIIASICFLKIMLTQELQVKADVCYYLRVNIIGLFQLWAIGPLCNMKILQEFILGIGKFRRKFSCFWFKL